MAQAANNIVSILELVPNYSDIEIADLGKKLQDEKSFPLAVLTIKIWFKKGECTKSNAWHFYSLLQSINMLDFRLMNEKQEYNNKLNEAKVAYRNNMEKSLLHFDEVEKMFEVACSKKVMDQFSTAQCKNIDFWKKQAKEIKNAYVEEISYGRMVNDNNVVGEGGSAGEHGDKTKKNVNGPNRVKSHDHHPLTQDSGHEQRSLQPSTSAGTSLNQAPPAVDYSDREVANLSKKLNNAEEFGQAVSILATWLKKGECNTMNAETFHSLIRSINAEIYHSMNNKLQYENKVNRAKLALKEKLQKMLSHFIEIGEMFDAATLPNVFDHFTKMQCKNIELWKNQAKDMKNTLSEELLGNRVQNVMGANGAEVVESPRGNIRGIAETINRKNSALEKFDKMQKELDSLRLRLKAVQNERALMKSRFQMRLVRTHCQLRKAMNDVQQMIKTLGMGCAPADLGIETVREEEGECSCKRRRIEIANEQGECSRSGESSNNSDNNQLLPTSSSNFSANSLITLTVRETSLMCIISAFLNYNPFGVNANRICSYLCELGHKVNVMSIEACMKKLPHAFGKKPTSANSVDKWVFTGFNCK